MQDGHDLRSSDRADRTAMEASHAPWPRLLVTAGHWVHAIGADAGGLTAADLFAVVIVWDSPEPDAWLGWLTTIDHRSLCFSASDLTDAGFLFWLSALPAWDSARMAIALGMRGLHQVWRRPGELPQAPMR